MQGITGDQREDMIYHISKMDTVYLQHRLDEAEKRAKEKPNGRPR